MQDAEYPAADKIRAITGEFTPVEYTSEGYVTAKPRVQYLAGAWWTCGPDYSWGPGTFPQALLVARWECIKYGPWQIIGGRDA